MKKETKAAFTAARAASAAVKVGSAAMSLLELDPTAWALADEAYWLCRAAAKAADEAAGKLDAEWAEYEIGVAVAYAEASRAAVEAQEMADELVSLAEAAKHEIRR